MIGPLYDGDPDRFPEGFSIFIASGALIGLWSTGSLRLPSGLIAEVGYWALALLGLFGIIWAGLGLMDRYIAAENKEI